MSNQESGFVLIVDDNSTNLSVLSQSLKSAGYKIRIAVDGESALALVERKQPDLILLDVQMPGIDGFETCRRLKANPITEKIPVIFMTALADSDSKVKGLSLGAVDYITKPFEEAEVLARVKIHWRLHQLTYHLEQQIAERTDALQKAQVQLVQQEKLSVLGQMVAGVAHEINNPINFLACNINPAKQYLADITKIFQLCQEHCYHTIPEIQSTMDEIDAEFVFTDFTKILESMELGTKRIKEISLSLRNFARSDIDCRIPFDLHAGLESTLLILKYRLKHNGERPEIEIIKKYGNLPSVECYPGQINQVFMNILANAIDALEEAWQKEKKSLTIEIITELSSNNTAIIRIADSGLGMTEEVKQRLFEPMFTTKCVGKGTGLGLSISQQIVEEKHGGQLSCNSVLGKGTEFLIEIPCL